MFARNAHTAVADTLDELAQLEFAEVERFIANVPPIERAVFLIEACRCLDHIHVTQFLSNKEEAKLSIQDFDILVRGWNVLFAILMRGSAEFSGMPLRASVPELRQAVVGMLHCAGRYVLLNRTAEMLRHGMVSAKVEGSEIKLSLSERTLTDHFHDQVDHRKFAELNGKALQMYRSIALDGQASRRMRDVMGKLTFPWHTSQGVMVGYTADPEVDAYFLAAVTEDTLQWRGDAGIHPDADLGGCSGELLTTVVHVLMSFCIKHIMFVEEALKIHPGINQHMSLTIWKTRAELLQTLEFVTGATAEELAATLDLITVRRRDVNFFQTEQAPGMPLLIEVSQGYLLTPVSAVFRNPLNCIRMLRESTSESVRNAFRQHRER